jgi:hypothetical protein
MDRRKAALQMKAMLRIGFDGSRYVVAKGVLLNVGQRGILKSGFIPSFEGLSRRIK